VQVVASFLKERMNALIQAGAPKAKKSNTGKAPNNKKQFAIAKQSVTKSR
jgi:hypothetical protein